MYVKNQNLSPRRGGFVVASELLLITVLVVIGLIAGWVTVRNTLNTELEDYAESVGDQDQSYAYAAIINDNQTANTAGSRYDDEPDENAADSNDGANDNDSTFFGSELTFDEFPGLVIP